MAAVQVYRMFRHLFPKSYVDLKETKTRFLCTVSSAIQKQESVSESEGIAISKWESVIGLEIHAQINANSKLFSGSGTTFSSPTNTQVSYFDAALPGTLPVLNKYCAEAGIRTALALNCTINKLSSFDRKHYFYSDMPAGYQITQQFHPLATNGHLEFYVYDSDLHIKPYKCMSRLKQVQLEQDSGRSFHIEGKKTLVDLNRAGIGLMELVFEPDLKSGHEAAMLIRELQLILMTIGSCSGVMEEGALRVDANISVHKSSEPWGVRTEVKNINSHKFIAKAIDFEIKRQIQILETGGLIRNETRSYDYKSKQTVSMRDKETFQDYRFMPEINLPILRLCEDSDVPTDQDGDSILNIDDLRRQLPLLPSQQRKHLMETYNISYENADKLVKVDGLQEYFEQVTTIGSDHTYALGFLTNNIQHQLNLRKLHLKKCPVPSNKVKDLITMVNDMTISDATADDILEMYFNGDQRSAKEIVENYNWFLLIDEAELEVVCRQVMSEMPKVAKKYRNSQKRYLMTSLLQRLNGKVNDRAHIKTAEAVFIRLIMNTGQKKASESQ